MKAKDILFLAAATARTERMSETSSKWQLLVQRLGELCPHGKSATVVAALGTAILAKATNVNVDVFSLLDRGQSANSYSARSLADNVWARHRAQLDIDLGANGTNPLNNTPFIGKTRIDDITGVRNRNGWQHFIDCLEQLSKIWTSSDALEALKGFIVARSRSLVATLDFSPEIGDHLSEGRLLKVIESFVSAKSEGGRRAQAVVAGILDVVYGESIVSVGVINDPDRRAPLDVSVKLSTPSAGFVLRDDHLIVDDSRSMKSAELSSNMFLLAVEVKDKPIFDHHIRSSVEKTIKDHSLNNLVFVAVGKNQERDIFDDVIKWAAQRGVKITVFCDWISFYLACKCFSLADQKIFEGKVFRRVILRLSELGVSREEIEHFLKMADMDYKAGST